MNTIIATVGMILLVYLIYLLFTQPEATARIIGRVMIGIFTILYKILQAVANLFMAIFRRRK
jgi:hypothetical protein